MIYPEPGDPYSWLEAIWSGLNQDDMSVKLFGKVRTAMESIEHELMKDDTHNVDLFNQYDLDWNMKIILEGLESSGTGAEEGIILAMEWIEDYLSKEEDEEKRLRKEREIIEREQELRDRERQVEEEERLRREREVAEFKPTMVKRDYEDEGRLREEKPFFVIQRLKSFFRLYHEEREKEVREEERLSKEREIVEREQELREREQQVQEEERLRKEREQQVQEEERLRKEREQQVQEEERLRKEREIVEREQELREREQQVQEEERLRRERAIVEREQELRDRERQVEEDEEDLVSFLDGLQVVYKIFLNSFAMKLLAILFPPIVPLIYGKFFQFLINIFLTSLLIIPGIIHSWMMIYDERMMIKNRHGIDEHF